METTQRNETRSELRQGQEVPEAKAEPKQVPEKRFSTGAISATVWKNQRQGKTGELFESHSVSLQRRYTDGSGKWMTTNSLRVNDLPKAALVLAEAYKYIVLQSAHAAEAQ